MSDFQGKAREMAGRVQEKVGEFTGDAKTQAEGLYNQAAGQAQQQIARLGDVITVRLSPSPPYLSPRRSVICWGGSPGNPDLV